MTAHSTQKELYGLIGYPVKHSYSAFMHNAAFAHCGMNAEYRLFEVSPEKLDEFFKKVIQEKRIRGFNITVPHKEAAVSYLDGIRSQGVNIIGAVNTIRVQEDGKLDGFNTDGPGFSRDLKEHGVEMKGKRIALLGAGGAAKAVAAEVAKNQARQLLIFDLDSARVSRLVGIVKEFYSEVDVRGVGSIEQLDITHADLFINATPIGMKEADPLLVKKQWLHPKLFVYDLIYNPAETKLLKAAQEAGCSYANGLGMLLYQGYLAFTHWTGEEAPVDVMRQALIKRFHG